MELKKMRKSDVQKTAGKSNAQGGSDDDDDDEDDDDEDEDDDDSDDDGNDGDGDNQGNESKKKARVQRGAGRIAQYALIDVDTARPMLELEGSIYLGRHEELLGTHLLFDIDAENEDGSERTRAELVGATSKTIVFDPVRLSKNPEYII
ncbi:hypothetical protein IW150_004056 [Coemansia sp. RSA 2607]|nr:hypothetical protein IW150_004056 [Coemansia sp. RSA 2607]